ncbi:hypothetical protein HDV06_006929 [Boothiomyces sp. JEL0866]|nr:hypothetical protein HDV06_006929 [Boothiomyces sp. JEL0866]
MKFTVLAAIFSLVSCESPCWSSTKVPAYYAQPQNKFCNPTNATSVWYMKGSECTEYTFNVEATSTKCPVKGQKPPKSFATELQCEVCLG